MPNVHPDPRPALASPPAGRFAFTQADDESPLRPLPREHDANGHYAIGPKLAQPALVKLIGARLDLLPAREKAPAAERRRMGREASRATHRGRARLLQALRGEFAPVRRTRAA